MPQQVQPDLVPSSDVSRTVLGNLRAAAAVQSRSPTPCAVGG